MSVNYCTSSSNNPVLAGEVVCNSTQNLVSSFSFGEAFEIYTTKQFSYIKDQGINNSRESNDHDYGVPTTALHSDMETEKAKLWLKSLEKVKTDFSFESAKGFPETSHIIEKAVKDLHDNQAPFIDLSHCKISLRNAVRISKALLRNDVVKEVNFEKSQLEYPALAFVILALKEKPSIVSINFSSFLFCPHDLDLIMSAFKEQGNLRSFDFSLTFIDEERVESLFRHLREFNSLTHLNLNHCNFGDDGLPFIISELSRSDSALIHLGLSHTCISYQGVIQILQALKTNNHLKSLELGELIDNDDENKTDYSELSQGIENNRTLTSLSLLALGSNMFLFYCWREY
eukprot:Awhi_evm1s14083